MDRVKEMPALVSIVGRKGSGKAEILEMLISILSRWGRRVGVIKRLAREDVEIDEPGSDTYRYRMQGAETVALAGRKRLAIFSNLDHEIPLDQLVYSFQGFDLVFLEGYFDPRLPKIEVHKKALGSPLLAEKGEKVLAVCSDEPGAGEVPRFSLEELDELALLIEEKLLKRKAEVSG